MFKKLVDWVKGWPWLAIVVGWAIDVVVLVVLVKGKLVWTDWAWLFVATLAVVLFASYVVVPKQP